MATAAKPKPTVAKTELSPLELHAIAQVAKAATKVRDHLKEGAAQEVDLTVRITGAMTVAPKCPADEVTSPSVKELLGLVLEFTPGGQRRYLISRLKSAYKLANHEDRPAAEPEFKKQAEELLGELTYRTEGEKRGNVTGSIACEVIERG